MIAKVCPKLLLKKFIADEKARSSQKKNSDLLEDTPYFKFLIEIKKHDLIMLQLFNCYLEFNFNLPNFSL